MDMVMVMDMVMEEETNIFVIVEIPDGQGYVATNQYAIHQLAN